MANKGKSRTKAPQISTTDYGAIYSEISDLLDSARGAVARSVNTVMTLTYWDIGRRIFKYEQGGKIRAEYGKALITRLAADLTQSHGRGFSVRNLRSMRKFYRLWPIWQTQSAKSEQVASALKSLDKGKWQTPSAIFTEAQHIFPLPWSHYVRLLSVEKEEARRFYEQEATRGSWSIRQLDRQINSQFFERTLLSRNKGAMLAKGAKAQPEDVVTPDEEVKQPYVLEFLDLKDEYSESELEQALIERLETFLLELGGDFAFVGRQRRLRIDDEWYRVDLVLFHRRLKCLVLADLKLTKLNYADIGQIHLYLNYARENWTLPGENPPVGLILCASKGEMLAQYALNGLQNKVLAAEYRTTLPDEKQLISELKRHRKLLES